MENINHHPRPQKARSLNDHRPIALTSLVMKVLEKLVKFHIMASTGALIYPLQFAYRTGRGVDDAKLFLLDTIHSHLESSGASARLLFVDFSSAFNTMQPSILASKLDSQFRLDQGLILWIMDFLTDRPQRVFTNGTLSDTLYTCTGSPQGCVLSPLLFILYTNDCKSTHANRHLVKFADDTVLLSLLSGSEQDHGPALYDFRTPTSILSQETEIFQYPNKHPTNLLYLLH